MEHDDLRAALCDLAAEVDGAHVDPLASVTEQGRLRRRRRAATLTVGASAVLVLIVAAGVAIAGNHQSPEVIATGSSSITVDSSTSAPSTTAGDVCTQADLDSYGPIPMPTPSRMRKTRFYDQKRVRLDPPAPGAEPKVAASTAWAGRGYGIARYEIVLTSYSSLYPLGPEGPDNWKRLSWVVLGTHVPSVPTGGFFLAQPGVTTVPPPACYFETELTLFDANTGQQLEISTF